MTLFLMKQADLEAHYDMENMTVIGATREQYEKPTKKISNNMFLKIQIDDTTWWYNLMTAQALKDNDELISMKFIGEGCII